MDFHICLRGTMNIGLIFERRTNDSHVIEFCDLYYVILIAGGS